MTYDSYGLSLTYFSNLQPWLPHFSSGFLSHCVLDIQLVIAEWSFTVSIMGHFLYMSCNLFLSMTPLLVCLSKCLWLGTRVSVFLYSLVLVSVLATSIRPESCENVDSLLSHINFARILALIWRHFLLVQLGSTLFGERIHASKHICEDETHAH